jgi:hypothetical protein
VISCVLVVAFNVFPGQCQSAGFDPAASRFVMASYVRVVGLLLLLFCF